MDPRLVALAIEVGKTLAANTVQLNLPDRTISHLMNSAIRQPELASTDEAVRQCFLREYAAGLVRAIRARDETKMRWYFRYGVILGPIVSPVALSGAEERIITDEVQPLRMMSAAETHECMMFMSHACTAIAQDRGLTAEQISDLQRAVFDRNDGSGNAAGKRQRQGSKD